MDRQPITFVPGGGIERPPQLAELTPRRPRARSVTLEEYASHSSDGVRKSLQKILEKNLQAPPTL